MGSLNPALLLPLLVGMGCQMGVPKATSKPAGQERDPVTVTVTQRRGEYVSGTDRSQFLQIGDITAGEVLVRLRGDGDLVPQRAMQVGDLVAFEADGQTRALGLTKMVNRLFGDDYAIFHIGSEAAVAKAQIASLLEQVETSRFEFVSEGRGLSGAEMARLLRERARPMAPIRSGKAFIDAVATTGPDSKPYVVSAGKGRKTHLANWLRGFWLAPLDGK